MSAALQPITARPIERPRYDNSDLGDFRFWYVKNKPRLIQYWEELGGYGEASEAEDFIEFALAQHDVERAQ